MNRILAGFPFASQPTLPPNETPAMLISDAPIWKFTDIPITDILGQYWLIPITDTIFKLET